jgi:cyclopropane-fatty-acyl-phospholipid synthase
MPMFPLSNMLKSFIQKGRLEVIDADGRRHVFAGAPGRSVVMRLSDRSLYRKLVFNPDMAVGEAYTEGTLAFEEGSGLRDFLALFSDNRRGLGRYPLQKFVRKLSGPLRQRRLSNVVGKAQANVAHHYDLGNDFYKLFLDANMLYSCAYFREEGDSLETAQRNKLRLLASKLDLKPGQRVLDIGSGWGDLALYIAAMEEVEVLGVTLSTEQQKLSTERAAAAGLSNRVRFELIDYRQVTGKFDRIVSVGMFEHVGLSHYDEFFDQINALMPDDGIALVHSIGHMSPPARTSSWLRKYIFPGAYSPSLSEVLAVVERHSLWVADIEVLRLHYARTLAIWEERFQANRPQVVAMHGERFARMWEFYLLSCETMFRTGAQMVFHLQLCRERTAVPIVRDYTVDTQRRFAAREAEMLPAV